jgi:hypothetical protein
MRRRVPFCLDSVEVGELKMVLELGFLAPERINSFPCVRNCLAPFRPFRTPFARRRTKPSRSDTPALRFGDPRVMAVVASLVGFCHLVGGFLYTTT